MDSGFSGGRVWRVANASGDLALRCWTPAIPAARIVAVHRTMQVARQKGWEVVPETVTTSLGSTCQRYEQRLWDLCSWRPGHPADEPVSQARLSEGMRILARWHSTFKCGDLAGLSNSLADEADLYAWRQDRPIVCLAARRRIAEWRRLAPCLLHSFYDAPADPLHLAERTRSAAFRLRTRMEEWLRSLELPVHVRLCLRDLHREHLLFSGDEVTGVIDLGAVGVDSPAADVARWLGDAGPSDPESQRTAIATYRKYGELNDDEAALIEPFERTGRVLAALHWLEWLVIEPRPFPNAPAAYSRWRSVVERLEREAG
jgi:homoserine kinase type II